MASSSSTIYGFRFTVPGSRGFTVLELIIVLVVIGILAASVSYRFSSTSDVSAEVAGDQVVADIRYVQMLATGKLEQNPSIRFLQNSSVYQVAGRDKSLPAGVFGTLNVEIFFDSLGGPFTMSGGTKVYPSLPIPVGIGSISVTNVTGKVAGG